MPDRRDALCAAAELILAIENAARTSGAVDTVATVGICDVFPGAVNSIPSRVQLDRGYTRHKSGAPRCRNSSDGGSAAKPLPQSAKSPCKQNS